MCLLYVKPKGIGVSDELLRQAQSDNKDGWGVARSINGKLVIDKGMSADAYFKYIKAIPEDEEAVIHNRWGNIGSKELYNCHPFRINEDFCLFHNGTIQIYRPLGEMSDTYSFAFNIIAPMIERNPEIYETDEFRLIVEEVIGMQNKLVMMRKDGKIVIFNKKQGTDHKGLWLSNNRSLYGPHWNNATTYSYKPPQHSVVVSQHHSPTINCWDGYGYGGD
jgi:predicted glutamine amidotransferase